MNVYIRSAEKNEQCKYVLIDDGVIAKKYYEEDEPVNFTREVKRYINEIEKQANNLLAQEVSEREIQEIIQGRQISDLEIQLLELQLGGV